MNPDTDSHSSTRVYHEAQESAFCGKHALNNLLQGAYFTEVDLASIAHELDKQERQLMTQNAGGVDSAEFLRYLQENENQNVDQHGNFSVQVLEKALEVMSLRVVRVHQQAQGVAKAAYDTPQEQQAFLCNLKSHWFVVRKLHGTWYNLNSLNRKPFLVSDFYLSAYLRQLELEGYSLFVVCGVFPGVRGAALEGTGGQWWPTSDIDNQAQPLSQEATSASESLLSSEDDLLQQAIAMSMQQSSGAHSPHNANADAELQRVLAQSRVEAHGSADDDADLRLALSLSMQQPHSQPQSQSPPPRPTSQSASQPTQPSSSSSSSSSSAPVPVVTPVVPEPPSENPLCLSLRLRWPDGSCVTRRFLSSDSVSVVLRFCALSQPSSSPVGLLQGFPRVELRDGVQTLREAGLCAGGQHAMSVLLS